MSIEESQRRERARLDALSERRRLDAEKKMNQEAWDLNNEIAKRNFDTNLAKFFPRKPLISDKYIVLPNEQHPSSDKSYKPDKSAYWPIIRIVFISIACFVWMLRGSEVTAGNLVLAGILSSIFGIFLANVIMLIVEIIKEYFWRLVFGGLAIVIWYNYQWPSPPVGPQAQPGATYTFRPYGPKAP
jgi:hypothetical protein